MQRAGKAVSDKTTHLAREDMTAAWCEAQEFWTDTSELSNHVDECNCYPCLDAVMAYAGQAMNRKLDLVGIWIAKTRDARGSE